MNNQKSRMSKIKETISFVCTDKKEFIIEKEAMKWQLYIDICRVAKTKGLHTTNCQNIAKHHEEVIPLFRKLAEVLEDE